MPHCLLAYEEQEVCPTHTFYFVFIIIIKENYRIGLGLLRQWLNYRFKYLMNKGLHVYRVWLQTDQGQKATIRPGLSFFVYTARCFRRLWRTWKCCWWVFVFFSSSSGLEILSFPIPDVSSLGEQQFCCEYAQGTLFINMDGFELSPGFNHVK